MDVVGTAHIVMVHIVMANIVMAPYSYGTIGDEGEVGPSIVNAGLNSYGHYGHGPYSYDHIVMAPHSYGPYSYGPI